MSKRMLIDASHPEETRLVILSGNRVEEFDFESAARRPLKGNIFLAKVTRVEPSLQAAFIEYGGNRHGFLAFGEIHPDYYQIPVADRQALLAAQRADERSRDHDDDVEPAATRGAHSALSDHEIAPVDPGELDPLPTHAAISEDGAELASGFDAVSAPTTEAGQAQIDAPTTLPYPLETIEAAPSEEPGETPFDAVLAPESDIAPSASEEDAADRADAEAESGFSSDDITPNEGGGIEEIVAAVETETIGAGEDDSMDEVGERRPSYNRMMRNYKIQEVIKKRQILLIQVVKEERGNKGAALTTYLSLAGRYCVLMPNSGRGGGISRKITNSADRRRLKDAAESLDVPDGMGLIVRTAGASRTKQEIQRDYEYLLRLWDSIRDLTLRSSAPALVYEEGNLIKRAIRDQFSREIEEIVVEGQEGYDEALAFTKMLMPHQLESVKQHDGRPPLFQKYKVESQLDSMFNPRVQLRSGGYIIINQTEALVAIDVNSGRSTREHSIEDTAVKTNLEAAEEVARQLRLRDLAGLIVIDFIDMEENRNDRSVERRLKDCLRHDRARIQIGRISPFGLMEMSRQRLRPGMVEGSTVACPHCNGTGLIRSVESLALRALRNVEEEAQQSQPEGITVRLPTEVAVYIFNHKRSDILAMEERLNVSIFVEAKTDMFGADCEVEIGTPGTFRPRRVSHATAVSAETALSMMPEPDQEDSEDEPASSSSNIEEVGDADAAGSERRESRDRNDRSRGRRRGRGRDGRDRRPGPASDTIAVSDTAAADPLPMIADAAGEDAEGDAPIEAGTEGLATARDSNRDGGDRRRRRRGRRGGRRNGTGRPEGELAAQDQSEDGEQAEDAPEPMGDSGQDTMPSDDKSNSSQSPLGRAERKPSAAAAIARFFGFGNKGESDPKDVTEAPASAAPELDDRAPPPVLEIAPEPLPAAPLKAEESPRTLRIATVARSPVEVPIPASIATPDPMPSAPQAEPIAEVAAAGPALQPPATMTTGATTKVTVEEARVAPAEPPPAPDPIRVPEIEKVEIVASGPEASGPPKGGWWKKREG